MQAGVSSGALCLLYCGALSYLQHDLNSSSLREEELSGGPALIYSTRFFLVRSLGRSSFPNVLFAHLRMDRLRAEKTIY